MFHIIQLQKSICVLQHRMEQKLQISLHSNIYVEIHAAREAKESQDRGI